MSNTNIQAQIVYPKLQKECCLAFETRNKKQVRVQMGTDGFIVGMMQRHREVHEQTFLKYSERIDGVKTLGWALSRTHLSPSWSTVILPDSPSLNCLPFVTSERLSCCSMEP